MSTKTFELTADMVHLFREGSWITVCCQRHGIDERIHLGTYDIEACTCPEYKPDEVS